LKRDERGQPNNKSKNNKNKKNPPTVPGGRKPTPQSSSTSQNPTRKNTANNNNNNKNNNNKTANKQPTPKPAVPKTAAAKVEKPPSPKPPPPPKKSHPPRGKASVVCGCFGTVHKPLANCLYCGRISCEREGYDFCPFCGLLVEPVPTNSDKEGDKAWEHKERLLRFDRDFARRTVVLDDQADYYQGNETWLTQNEAEEAKVRESARNDAMHKRKKQTLDIVF